VHKLDVHRLIGMDAGYLLEEPMYSLMCSEFPQERLNSIITPVLEVANALEDMKLANQAGALRHALVLVWHSCQLKKWFSDNCASASRSMISERTYPWFGRVETAKGDLNTFSSSLLRTAGVDDLTSAINVDACEFHLSLLDSCDVAKLITQAKSASERILKLVADHWAKLATVAAEKLKPALQQFDWKAQKHLLIKPEGTFGWINLLVEVLWMSTK
jgi:hypothetical protein